ncbi:hypothetical protein BY458DRAFT_515727 [Sporodiniella umbellata]|nr:hypothetical protein BY458DRAFT_515727 [Sporodiniella umbellata]
MQSQEWPKLPSIQSMLEGVSLNEAKPKGHRRHASEHSSAFKPFVDRKAAIETSMSGQLERLSIQPIPIEPKVDEPQNQASLYRPLPFRPHLSSYRSPRHLHTRSYSDYTHPYPPSTAPAKAQAYHRRAVSTNTFDFLLQPLSHLSNNATPPLVYGTCSPTSSQSSVVTLSHPLSPTLPSEEDSADAEEQDAEHDEEEDDNSSSGGSIYSESHKPKKNGRSNEPSGHLHTGRKRRLPPSKKYYCSYCSKGFSRPSSLRIHTYSHTGERPFECPEKDCHRKFSVQSNMRRHLRVHRTGRPTRRNGSSLTPAEKAQLINKPLAAKPISWGQDSATSL